MRLRFNLMPGSLVVRLLSLFIVFVVGAPLISAPCVSAQLIHQEVPLQNLNSSYYEQFGVNWNLRGPGFFANFGGGGVVPPFGNFDPNAGGRVGVGFGGGGVSGNLGLTFNQGSSRSISSTTPSLTTLNGYPGSITSQTLRPFVTGVTPIVGGRVLVPIQPPVSAAQQIQNAYQQTQQQQMQRRAVASAEAGQQKALESFNRGLRAETEGNLKMARANYRNALRTAQGPLRIEIQKRMLARGWR